MLQSPTDRELRSLVFIGTTGYAAGKNGEIIKTAVNLGITQISTEAPQGFHLAQNFPNPFNPTTNIEFNIAENGFVSLKVYDITGKEVGNLVNQNLPKGTYKVNWAGNGLSSGIYFYRLSFMQSEGDPSLRSGRDFIETKKMMLVK